MKKNILINHLREPGNTITGITNYLFYLLDELLDGDKFDYTLLTCWDEDQLPGMLKGRGMTIVTRPFIESTPKNILSQLVTVPRMAKKYQSALEFNPNPVGSFIGSIPLVTVCHDLYFDILPKSYKFHHRLWWKMFFPLTLRRAKKNISVSSNTQNDLLKFYPWARPKSYVVKEAACLSGELTHENRSPVGLFVANVSPNKGARVLLEAMGILSERGILCDIYHVGRDPEGYFEQLASELSLKVKPITLGYLSDKDLHTQYCQARFLAFPSSYEGFGLPILEAQRFGLPVIASDIPVLREVAGKGALFFELGNASQLADKMEQLLTDEEVFSTISEEALQNERTFSWEKAARETEGIFREALA